MVVAARNEHTRRTLVVCTSSVLGLLCDRIHLYHRVQVRRAESFFLNFLHLKRLHLVILGLGRCVVTM